MFSTPSVWAAAAATAPAATEEDLLQQVIVTGTRQIGIVAAESAAPIQIVAGEALQATGKATLIDALAQLVPSFQAQAFGGDMANQTLQARLRGLSPNHVLVLVDGKRRHTTASIAVLSGSAYSGGAGVDLNFIPLASVDHIEVLTEGAAAQYGSDAIAGVINIILKKNNSGGTLDGSYGRFFDGGGNTSKVEGNVGFAPTDNSFLNLTAQFANHAHTNRGNADPRTNPAYWQGEANPYPNSNIALAPGYPYMNQIQGDSETHFKLVAYNAGVTLPGDVELYSNATYGSKDAQSFENYRVPGKVVFDPTTAAATAAGLGLTPPDCGATPCSIPTYPFPLGFNPLEQSKEDDFQIVFGVKGSIFGFNWDLAQAYGEDHMKVSTINSANASLYAATGSTPTNFYDGKFISTQSTTTLDLSRDFDLGLAGPLTVAVGAEHRRETWLLGPGELSSYIGGGAQSFPGYSAVVATNSARHSDAGYIDLAATPIEGLKLDAAGRYEAYSDFGDATVGKFTARYDFNPAVAIRGTISSGFRAPTLVEEHYTNVNVGPTTAFVQLAPDGPGTGLLGLGGGLKPERSTNLSFGVVLRPIERLTATIDAYQIVVTNRIVASGNINGQSNGVPFPGSANVTAAIAASGLSIDPGVLATGTTGINLFANGIDTRTRGVDITLSSPLDFAYGHIDFTVGGSYNYTVATKVLAGTAEIGGQPLFDAQSISALATQSPRVTLNMGAHYTVSKYFVDLHEIIYGKSSSCDNPDSDTTPNANPNVPLGPACSNLGGGLFYYENKIGTVGITNLEVGTTVMDDRLTLAVGANNLFNRYPNQVNGAYYGTEALGFDNAAVQKYPSFSPFGINGGFYYARLHFKF